MRAALDAHGDFATKIDGTLEFPDFIIFRSIITRQASRMFMPKRAELNEQKLAVRNIQKLPQMAPP